MIFFRSVFSKTRYSGSGKQGFNPFLRQEAAAWASWGSIRTHFQMARPWSERSDRSEAQLRAECGGVEAIRPQRVEEAGNSPAETGWWALPS